MITCSGTVLCGHPFSLEAAVPGIDCRGSAAMPPPCGSVLVQKPCHLAMPRRFPRNSCPAKSLERTCPRQPVMSRRFPRVSVSNQIPRTNLPKATCGTPTLSREICTWLNFSSAAPLSCGDSAHLRPRQAGGDLGAGVRMGRMAAAASTTPPAQVIWSGFRCMVDACR